MTDEADTDSGVAPKGERRRRVSVVRRLAPWGLLAVAAAGLLTGRVLYMSRLEVANGQDAYARGDWPGAVVAYRRAAHWYAPGSPYVMTALDELRRIGRRAEMEGQHDVALAAYRAIRTSCLGTRSFYTPHEDRLEEANGRIAALLARAERPPMDRGKTVDQLRREHLELLTNVEAPDPVWAAVACLSFVAWIALCFAFISRGLTDELRIKRRPAAILGTLVVVSLAAWVLALIAA